MFTNSNILSVYLSLTAWRVGIEWWQGRSLGSHWLPWGPPPKGTLGDERLKGKSSVIRERLLSDRATTSIFELRCVDVRRAAG